MNKKGFTLVELLSVITILSVVVLIAANAVVPMMSNAKKQVLATEANKFITAAKTLYVQENQNTTKCYTYQEILASGLIEKNDENYTGSFEIKNDNGSYSYRIWLSNGKNIVDGKTPDVTASDVDESSNNASTTCGASTASTNN